MRESEQLNDEQVRLLNVVTRIRDEVSALPLGIRPPQNFGQTVANFLKRSSGTQRESDEKYVDAVYLAIINLQNHILAREPVDDAKKELESMLYDPRRYPDRQHFLAGVQSSKIFAERACATITRVRDEMLGTGMER